MSSSSSSFSPSSSSLYISNQADSRQRTPSVSTNPAQTIQATQPTTAAAQEQLSKTNLYIRGLQTSTKDQDLHDMCNRFGHIISTKAILDKSTGCCRGYGFVEFVNAKSAELAVRELTKSGIQAQMAKISSSYLSHANPNHNNNNNNNNTNSGSGGGAGGGNQHHGNQNNNSHQYNNHHKSNRNGGYNSNNNGPQHNHNSSNNAGQKINADPTNLYIANLPPDMCEPELEELLSSYGNIVSTRILRDESNNPRGVGFARMESRDTCEAIIEQLNGRPYKGSFEPLVVKFADGGNKKRYHYNNHQHQHHSNNNNNNNNNNHHNHLAQHKNQKANRDEGRWQDSVEPKEVGAIQTYDPHQGGNMPHSNQPPDLAMIGAIRMQPGYPPNVANGGAYPAHLGPPSSGPQWIPTGGQPYVMPPQMTQTGGLSPSGQAVAPPVHYGHIPHLAAQMQGLQITHAAPHLGGYFPPHHQWPAMWPHPIPQQSPSPMGRLATGSGPVPIVSQHSSQFAPMQQQSPQIHQSPHTQRPAGQQQQVESIDSKLHVSVPL